MGSYQKYEYSGINIKRVVAKQFREFSKAYPGNHTEVLHAMINFFETHQWSPYDSMDGSLTGVEKRLKKRISAVIAIIRNMEKEQTKPTNAMLQALFAAEDDLEQEIQEFPIPNLETKPTKNKMQLEYEKEQLEKQLLDLGASLKILFDAIEIKNSSFGKTQIRIHLEENNWIKLKRKILNQLICISQ